MTEQDKQLLLRDLCSRLPYKLKVKLIDEDNVDLEDINVENGYSAIYHEGSAYELYEVKPYLRPMSSMTDEEWKEYNNLNDNPIPGVDYERLHLSLLDWFNSHHFDYRNLIDKNLALEAPKGMYEL